MPSLIFIVTSHLIIHHQSVNPALYHSVDRDVSLSPPNSNPRLPLSPQILLRVGTRLLLLLLLLRRHDVLLVLLLRRERLSRPPVLVRRDVLGRYLEGRRRASEHPCGSTRVRLLVADSVFGR